MSRAGSPYGRRSRGPQDCDVGTTFLILSLVHLFQGTGNNTSLANSKIRNERDLRISSAR